MTLLFLLRISDPAARFEISAGEDFLPLHLWTETGTGRYEYRHHYDGGALEIQCRLYGPEETALSLTVSSGENGQVLKAFSLGVEAGGMGKAAFQVPAQEPQKQAAHPSDEDAGTAIREDILPQWNRPDLEAEEIDDRGGSGEVLEESAVQSTGEFSPEEAPAAMPAPAAPPPARITRTVSRNTIRKAQDTDGAHAVDVFYATDRDSYTERGKTRYGVERGELQYGICTVNIPPGKARGEVPRPVWWKLQFRENAAKHVMILETAPLPQDAFFEKLRQTVTAADKQDAFVFVHGYNVSFDEAAMRTAQIAYDVDFHGAPILYSWPSRASVSGYFSDEDNVQYSSEHMLRFLRDVHEKTGARQLHLIAHSMGNRALTRALVDLQEVGYFGEPCFNQIILAAPDIDAEIFLTQIAPKLIGCSDRVTLYASSKDNALRASRSFRKNLRRAGDGGDAIVCHPALDTVDASAVDTDLLGHSYFSDALPLLADMERLLHKNQPPGERALKPARRSGEAYWTF